MAAVARFLPKLPVDRYTFLAMVGDTRWAGDVLFSGKPSIGGIIKVARSLGSQGFGALEHNTSSLYYLGDFGSGERMPAELRVEKQLLDAAVLRESRLVVDDVGAGTCLGLRRRQVGLLPARRVHTACGRRVNKRGLNKGCKWTRSGSDLLQHHRHVTLRHRQQ